MTTVADGVYFIKNANDQTFMASNGNGAVTTLQTATGSTMQIWTVIRTNQGYTLQNYGTAGYLAPDGTGGVTTQVPSYAWLLPPNTQISGSFSIQDTPATTNVLGMNSQDFNAPVLYETASNVDNRQCWYFTATTY